MAALDLDDLADVLSTQVTQVLRPVHLEGAKEADLGMPAVHDHGVALALQTQHAQVSNLCLQRRSCLQSLLENLD